MKLKLIYIAIATLSFGINASANDMAWQIIAKDTDLIAIDSIVNVEDKHYWVSIQDMQDMGLDVSKLPVVNTKIDLAVIATIEQDDNNNILNVKFNPKYLPVTNINLLSRGLFQKPSKPQGTFLNYDVRTDYTFGKGLNSVAGTFEANTFIKGIRVNYQGAGSFTTKNLDRISFNLSQEDVDTSRSWMIGDGSSVAGYGVAPVRFTGIQYKNDFALNPTFVTSPTFGLSGVATAPSTLDILMGNQVVKSQAIPAGPFDITNMQPLLGVLGVQVVVKDTFGYQQVINSPIIGSVNLLKKGLSDFSVQAGQIRPTLNRTESPFASGFYRLGLTDWMTLEGNAEASKAGQTLKAVHHAGISASIASPVGQFSVSGRTGTGTSADVNYQNAWHPIKDLNITVHAGVSKTSTDYLQMGGGSVSPSVKSIGGIIGYKKLSLTALATQNNGMNLFTSTVVLSPAKSNGITWSATTSITSNVNQANSKSQSLMLFASIPLDTESLNRNQSVLAGVSQTGNSNPVETLDYTNYSTNGIGGSYKVRTELAKNSKRIDTSADFKEFFADIGIATSTSQTSSGSTTGVRGYIKGGVVYDSESGYVVMTNPINTGYAIVDSGAKDTIILVNNSPKSKSNKNGMAVVTDFVPLLKTAISLDEETAPDNYDNNEVLVSTYNKSSVNVSFRKLESQVQIAIPNVAKGMMTINNQNYPITERGIFVELIKGDYVGEVDGQKYKITIPAQSDELIHITAVPKNNKGV